MGAGKKRSITFNRGESDLEVIEAKGILKGDLAVYINDGMPNTSSKYFQLNSEVCFQNYPVHNQYEQK